MRSLIVVGAGGHARETLDVIDAINAADSQSGFAVVGCVADRADEHLLARRGVSWLGPMVELAAQLGANDAVYHLAIGSPSVRAEIDAALRADGYVQASLIDPRSSVGSDNEFGDGAFLGCGARVTTHVRFGRGVQLNVNAVASHDVRVGDHCTLSPGVMLNGNVTVGARVFLGTGSIVIPGCTIGDDAVVGAGSVVVRDVPAGVTAVGVPARWSS